MYTPDIQLYQRENSIYLIFEDQALQNADLTDIEYSTLRIYDNKNIDVTINLEGENGIIVDTPDNGYRVVIPNTTLGYDQDQEIADNVFSVVYSYSYTIGGIVYANTITRRFALYAITERKVYQKFLRIHEYYHCDKPWASKYIKDALAARALLKSLETSAYLGFDEDYYTILETLTKILDDENRYL